jgi:hypothetical protein
MLHTAQWDFWLKCFTGTKVLCYGQEILFNLHNNHVMYMLSGLPQEQSLNKFRHILFLTSPFSQMANIYSYGGGAPPRETYNGGACP